MVNDATVVVFDDERAVANAGVILPALLAGRLGIERLVDAHVDLGERPVAANPGCKVMSMVSAMALGADCIEDCDVLGSGQTAAVLDRRIRGELALEQTQQERAALVSLQRDRLAPIIAAEQRRERSVLPCPSNEPVHERQRQEDEHLTARERQQSASERHGRRRVAERVDERERMENTAIVAVRMSTDKAYTAAVTRMPTADWQPLVQPGESLFGLTAAEGGRIVCFGGGIPLERDGRVVGAIGVSGGSVQDDVAIAEAGCRAWTRS